MNFRSVNIYKKESVEFGNMHAPLCFIPYILDHHVMQPFLIKL